MRQTPRLTHGYHCTRYDHQGSLLLDPPSPPLSGAYPVFFSVASTTSAIADRLSNHIKKRQARCLNEIPHSVVFTESMLPITHTFRPTTLLECLRTTNFLLGVLPRAQITTTDSAVNLLAKTQPGTCRKTSIHENAGANSATNENQKSKRL